LRRPTHNVLDIPTRAVSPRLAVSVWIDELVKDSVPRMPQVPLGEVKRFSADVAQTLKVCQSRGWLEVPVRFYVKPPVPEDVEIESCRFAASRYLRLSFESGYEPDAEVPGAVRWLESQRSQRVHAFVLRHREPNRPWLVNLRGYSAGKPFDLVAFRSLHHYRDLGYNVIYPVLSLHGNRARDSRQSGAGIFTLDYVQDLHAFGHAVWDVRRCLEWIRARVALPSRYTASRSAAL
jgi:hypothetical protein